MSGDGRWAELIDKDHRPRKRVATVAGSTIHRNKPVRRRLLILLDAAGRYGLPQICCRISHLQRSRLPLLVRRKSRHRPVYLDAPQWHQEGNALPSIDDSSTSLTAIQEDGSRCSILSFDVNANKSRLPLAKNALRKFRTLRHPGVVKVLDTVEVVAFTAHIS